MSIYYYSYNHYNNGLSVTYTCFYWLTLDVMQLKKPEFLKTPNFLSSFLTSMIFTHTNTHTYTHTRAHTHALTHTHTLHKLFIILY